MGEPISDSINKLKNWLLSQGLSELLVSFTLFMIFLFLSTLIHESIHTVTAWLLHCEAGIQQVFLFTGLTGVECSESLNFALVAISAPIGMFLVGLYLWFAGGENDPFSRLFAIINWLYGSIPNMTWWNIGTDFNQALVNGIDVTRLALIFVIVVSVVAYLISKEIAEKEPF